VPKLRKAKAGTGIRYHFMCPGCKEIHGCQVPGWTFNGDINKPTFNPSLLVTYGKEDKRRCHSFIKGGQIQFLNDCTHELAGKTVEIPEWQEKW